MTFADRFDMLDDGDGISLEAFLAPMPPPRPRGVRRGGERGLPRGGARD